MMGLAFMLQYPLSSSWLVRLSLLAASSPSYYNSQVPVRGAKDGDARTEIGGGSAGNATPKSAGEYRGVTLVPREGQ